jgi:hypothetical protein
MSLLLLGRITVYNNTITLWNFDNAIVNFLPLPWPFAIATVHGTVYHPDNVIRKRGHEILCAHEKF